MSQDQQVFKGGVAVITGAGAGIGAGLARRAAELGMRVVLADVSRERLDEVAGELRTRGSDVLPVVVDVSRPEELFRLAEVVHTTWGDVRLLVNNAGIETVGFAWEVPTERWEKTLHINLHGVIHGCRAFLPRMLAHGQPAWVANLASVGAFGQMPLQTAYMVTKHAVQAFTECLALEVELSGKPVRVCSIIPGMVKTRIFDPAEPAAGETPAAAHHRKVMRELMAAHGMELDVACRVLLEKVAAGEFWASTQPEMTEQIVAGRIQFLRDKARPALNEQTRALVQG